MPFGAGAVDLEVFVRAVLDARFHSDLIGGLSVLTELAEILDDMHAAGLANRDVKLANVLIGPSGLVLSDFSLCLELDDDGARLTNTDEAVRGCPRCKKDGRRGVSASSRSCSPACGPRRRPVRAR